MCKETSTCRTFASPHLTTSAKTVSAIQDNEITFYLLQHCILCVDQVCWQSLSNALYLCSDASAPSHKNARVSVEDDRSTFVFKISSISSSSSQSYWILPFSSTQSTASRPWPSSRPDNTGGSINTGKYISYFVATAQFHSSIQFRPSVISPPQECPKINNMKATLICFCHWICIIPIVQNCENECLSPYILVAP